MVTRSRLLAAHGLTSCLSVRTQPLTATGAPSQTSTIPYHTIHDWPSTTFSSVQFSHQEQAPKQRCTFSSTTFSSVQFTTGPFLLPLMLPIAVILLHTIATHALGAVRVMFLLIFVCLTAARRLHEATT